MALNSGGHGFKRLRRFLQGRGVEYRRNATVAGAASDTPIAVPGLKSTDELISVLHFVTSDFATTPAVNNVVTDVVELLTETATPAVQASATPTQAGANNDITWNAQTPSYEGTKGNSLSVEYLTGGNNKVLGVDVINGTGGQETKVSVQLATDGAGAGTSTANQVIDAVAAHPQAASMVFGEASEGTGDGLSVAVAATSLTGGVNAYPKNVTIVVTAPMQASVTPAQAGTNNDILWNAQLPGFPGTKGNSLSVEMLNAGASKALSVDVINGAGGQETKVSITLATDAGSVITSTANQAIDAVAAHPQAKDMLYGEASEGTGDGLSVAVAATSLAGGADESVAIQTPTSTVDGRIMVDFLSHAA